MPVHTDEQGLPARDNWIAWALLASLVLHAPLFVPSGAWQRGWPGEAPTLPLEVRIQPSEAPADGPAEEQAREVEQAASERVVVTSEHVAAGAGDTRPRDRLLESVDEDGDRESMPEEDSLTRESDPKPPAAFPAEADGLPDEADALPTATDLEVSRDSTETAPVHEPVAAPEALVATLAPADASTATIESLEPARLTRRIARVAQEQLNSGAREGQFTFQDQNRSFTAAFTREPAGDTGIERVTLDLTTAQGGEQVRTSLQMKRLTFSHFTQLVDRWDDSVQLHDDEIAGRFHSNSAIHLTYDQRVAPRLLGRVTTTRGILIDDAKGWRPRREIFAGGLDTRSARIRLPQISLPLTPGSTISDADIREVHSDALVVFHADGNYDCVELASGAIERGQLENKRLTYIIASPGTELYVRGVINGSVTVYSPERIVVQDDLIYAHDPRAGDDADAYLGLVSDGNIEIDRPEVTGPGDLQIHGAVYARKRFVVRNAGARGPATLSIYGSLTAGSVTRTEPRYATRIEYDPRFERTRPPGFPQTDRYEIESWDERWRIADAPVP
jgi:hypothetical protein